MAPRCRTSTITRHFADLPDPRVKRTRLHKLEDILTIAICAVLCGADDWVEIAEFGRARKDWLGSFLELPNGIPSHDTFRQVFMRLDPQAFERCFAHWVQHLARGVGGAVVALDGKTARGSVDWANGKGAVHLVSAWAAEHRLTLGQLACDGKSNEITALPELLQLLDLKDALVTIDAIGAQKAICRQIRRQRADYVIALKDNQPTFHREVQAFFAQARRTKWRGVPYSYTEETSGGHGRVEVRKVWSTNQVTWFADRQQWTDLRSLALVERHRQVGDQTTVEQAYYFSSADGSDARVLAHAIRAHWGIENQLHWVLDVAFREDHCRSRAGHSSRNFALLRRLALNLLRHETTRKIGIKAKRRLAGWDPTYLAAVLAVKI